MHLHRQGLGWLWRILCLAPIQEGCFGEITWPLHINNTILNCEKNYAAFSFIVVSHPKADARNDCFGDLGMLKFNLINPNHCFTIYLDIGGQTSFKPFATLIPYLLSCWCFKISFKMLNAVIFKVLCTLKLGEGGEGLFFFFIFTGGHTF